MLLKNSLYVLNWDALLSILDLSPVLRSLLHMWYTSASSNSECHIAMFFIFDLQGIPLSSFFTGHRMF